MSNTILAPFSRAMRIALRCAAAVAGVVAHQQPPQSVLVQGPGAGVDLATCEPSGPGADTLCEVWTDPEFDRTAPAVYYARVLENPTCRWSRRICNALAVDCATVTAADRAYACCDPAGPPDTIQERAWTSPIWYLPG